MLTAYVDESQMKGTGSGGTYFLGSTIVLNPDDEPEYRDVLTRLKPRSATKLHWYDAVPKLRERTVQVVAQFDLIHWVVEHQVVVGDSSERSRRACLEVLIQDLGTFGVERIIFESRGSADNRRDMDMLDALRAKKRLQGTRIDHVLGSSEPLLWIPDAVLGTIEASLLGEHQYRSMLAEHIGMKTTT